MEKMGGTVGGTRRAVAVRGGSELGTDQGERSSRGRRSNAPTSPRAHTPDRGKGPLTASASEQGAVGCKREKRLVRRGLCGGEVGGWQLGLQTLGTGADKGVVEHGWDFPSHRGRRDCGLCGDEGGPGSHQGPAGSSRSSCVWGLGWQVAAATPVFSCSHPLTPQCHLRPICAGPGAEMWGEQSSPGSCPRDSQAAEGPRLEAAWKQRAAVSAAWGRSVSGMRAWDRDPGLGA